MIRRLTRTLFILAGLCIACSPIPSFALFINPDYGDFAGVQLAVLEDAVKEWSDLLPCTDGKTVDIEFVCDVALGSLGLTNVWFDGDGNVARAKVTLDNDGLYFDLTKPEDWPTEYRGSYDALSVAKHEVGHAIGFIHGGKFMNDVTVVEGDRFYDMNGDGVLNDNDLDLEDGDNWQGHAASRPDVMFATFDRDERRLPSLHDAQVLADAYGYCVVPEPATLLIWLLLGVVSAAACRRRRV